MPGIGSKPERILRFPARGYESEEPGALWFSADNSRTSFFGSRLWEEPGFEVDAGS